MYNKKCHIVAFLHSEKAKNIYFLFLVLKKTKNKFLGLFSECRNATMWHFCIIHMKACIF